MEESVDFLFEAELVLVFSRDHDTAAARDIHYNRVRDKWKETEREGGREREKEQGKRERQSEIEKKV